MPFLSQHADENLYWVELCHRYETEVIKILEQWHEPVDIIFVAVEYFNFYDPPISEEDDEYLIAMQRFYDSLNKIARDVVFIPGVHIDWGAEPFSQILQKNVNFQLDYRTFQKTAQEHANYLPNVQKRISSMLKCEKCLKVDWSKAWCFGDVCHALDDKHITYFRDTKHISAYGSLVYGRMLRELYNQYLVNRTTIT
jgi:hypothetical protein